MQNQQLFEAPFVSEVGTNGRSKCNGAGAGRCACKRCQSAALPFSNSRIDSQSSQEAQWLFEASVQSDRETLLEWEVMQGESGGEGWFWQSIYQASSAIKSAMINLQKRNVPGARQALEIARQRTTLAGSLAGKTMKKLAFQQAVKQEIAHGHVAIQRSQRHLSENKVNLAAAFAELKKAHERIAKAMKLATAKSGTKVWN
jgi:hypothetical protein